MWAIKKAVCLLIAAATAAAMISAAAIPASAASTNMLKGDLNGDGKITLKDATFAQKIQLGLEKELDGHKYVGDLDSSGSITLADAYIIQRLVTHDPAVMEGSAAEGIPALCPNWGKRMSFFEALNEERAAQGLPTIECTDGMLAAGQELCDVWYAERSDQDNPNRDSFSGYRNVVDDFGMKKRWATVFDDYGISGYYSGAIIDASYGKKPSGSSYFSSIRSDVDKKGKNSYYYSVYYDLLMKKDLKALCVGEVVASSSSACWIIAGF